MSIYHAYKKPRVWDRYNKVKAAEKAVAPPPPPPPAPALPAHRRVDKVSEAAVLMLDTLRPMVTKKRPEVPGAILIEAARAKGYNLQDCISALGRLVQAGLMRRGERGFYGLGHA